jgi:hypothetical protein
MMICSLSSVSGGSNNVKPLKTIKDSNFDNYLISANSAIAINTLTGTNLATATMYWSFTGGSGYITNLMRGISTHCPTTPTNTNGTAVLLRGDNLNITQYVNLLAGNYRIDLDYLYRSVTYGGNSGIITITINDVVVVSSLTLPYYSIWKPLSSAGTNTFTLSQRTNGILKITKTIVLNSTGDNSLNLTNIYLTKL